MELRIESPTDYRLNIHIILSDKLTEQELIDFKSELQIRAIGKKLSDQSLILYAKSLDSSKAQKHGFSNQPLNDEELLQLGSKTAEITKESLTKAFTQIPENMGYIIMPYDTTDGLEKLNWEEHPHDDNYFMQSSHIFETRNPANINLINCIQTEENKKFINFFRQTIGKPKPCISGSDAHRYEDYGKYPSEKITWIKSDPSFDGLRQILYEPLQRVKIQVYRPDFKDSKLILDKVRFISSENKFTDENIYLNDNLNVIIGGKSSGKSILLYCIAKTLIADKEFFDKADISNKYQFESEDPSFNFEITTKSGFSQLMFRPNEEKSVIPEIKFIPQNYLIKLAEPENYKKGAALNKIVRDLIKEDSESKIAYDDFISKLQANDRKRENLIDDYFEIADRISELEKQLETKSNPDVLNKNIAINLQRVKELNESAGLNVEEIEKFELLQKQFEEVEIKESNGVADLRKLNIFLTELNEIFATQKSKQLLLLNSLVTEEFDPILTQISSVVNTATDQLKAILSKFVYKRSENGDFEFENLSELSQFFISLKKYKEELNNSLKPFLANEAIKKEIDQINESISVDRADLQSITQLTKEVQENKKALSLVKTQLFILYTNNCEEYKKVIEKLKIRTSELQKDGLKLDGLIKFNVNKFRDKILDFSDGRKASYREFNILSDERKALDDISFNGISLELKEIFSAIVEKGTYSLLSRISKKEAIKVLLDDYFFDYWQIEYKGDKLDRMSAGKASFVILMLIVGLSKSKAPLLIDQPEDNLDNRSITTELVEYLRNKKMERQIILVTHNPNIVVNADAENIIIAHQKSQDELGSGSPFAFDYINGSLENSSPLNENEPDILKRMGIREHIADIVEGGEEAFKKREEKYGFN